MIRLALLFLLLAGPLVAEADRPAFSPRIGATLPDLELTGEDGRATTLRETIAGRPALLLFGLFQCDNLCDLTEGAVAATLKETGLPPGEVRALFVSLDAAETPADAREARDRLERLGDPLPGWGFLGGPRGAELARAAGMTLGPEEDAHPVALLVLTPEARISRAFAAPFLLRPEDLRLSLVEASAGGIGTFADRIVLLCSGFDEATGRYTPLIHRAIQVGGGATALALAALVLLLERRRA